MKSKAAKTVKTWLATSPARPLLVVLGPTASGKTALALEIAATFGGEIVNADSRQIYRELEIGSAPPTPAEMRKISHHFVAEFSPNETVSVAKYRKLAEAKIREIRKRGKLPILAGGHTLLISAIVENYKFAGKVNPARRAELAEIWEKNPARLHAILRKLDSVAAAKIPAANRHHLIRAVERAENLAQPQKGRRKFDVLLLGLNPPREKLYARIDRRVEKMLADGLLDEVKRLAQKYERYSPALRGHGYRELLDFLNGEKAFGRAVEEIKKDTRNYAKRQMSWWRNSSLNKEIFWV